LGIREYTLFSVLYAIHLLLDLRNNAIEKSIESINNKKRVFTGQSPYRIPLLSRTSLLVHAPGKLQNHSEHDLVVYHNCDEVGSVHNRVLFKFNSSHTYERSSLHIKIIALSCVNDSRLIFEPQIRGNSKNMYLEGVPNQRSS
jgi:hypothetical protein